MWLIYETLGLFSPRESTIPGRPLPDARLMSVLINRLSGLNANTPEIRARRESPINSLHMMQIGQFLDHDITHAAAQDGKRGTIGLR